jgi:hypothetical protein
MEARRKSEFQGEGLEKNATVSPRYDVQIAEATEVGYLARTGQSRVGAGGSVLFSRHSSADWRFERPNPLRYGRYDDDESIFRARRFSAGRTAESIGASQPDRVGSMVELPHAVAMSILGVEIPSQRIGFLIGSAVLVVIGIALLALAPSKQSVEKAEVVASHGKGSLAKRSRERQDPFLD